MPVSDQGESFMKKYLMATGLVLILGCSAEQSATEDGLANQAVENGSTAAASAASLPTGEEGLRRYAECASTFEALSALFGAIASQSEGEQKTEMQQTATARGSAAAAYEQQAIQIASTLPGRSATDVKRIKDERQAQIKQQEESQEFSEFGVGLGREGDTCTKIMPSTS